MSIRAASACRWFRYATAVVLVGLADLARWGVPQVLGPSPFLVFYPAVVLAAALGGFGPGILATLLASLSVDILFTPPLWRFSPDPLVWARHSIFVAGGIGISLLARLLRQNEQRHRGVAQELQAVMEAVPAGICVGHDPQCSVITGNAVAHETLGVPPNGNLSVTPGQQSAVATFRMYRDGIEAVGHEMPMQVAAATGATVQNVEYEVLRADGTRRTILLNASPLRRADGTIRGVVGAFADITARKLAEESMRESAQRYRTLFNAIDEGFCIIQMIFDEDDKPIDYRFLETNPSFEKQTGLINAQGKTIRELIPSHEQSWFDIYGRVIATGQPIRFQNQAGQLRRWYDVYAFRFGQPEDRQVAVLFQDITQRRQDDEQLRAAQRSAENAKAGAEAANNAKNHFLAVLSHELRNPLNPVLATASMLHADPRFDDDTREQLEVICRNAELEARLIDDLLDVTRIERGKIELDRRTVELSTILRRAVEVCQPDIEARMLEFGLDTGPAPFWVRADAARLQQVFWNLLRNAIKFTPHGGCVGIRCHADKEGFVVAEVTDSGEGIDPDALGRIFNAFEQAERSITRQFGGLGLGLTISKALVELHGGSIHARSEGKGRGATFAVRLPLVPSPGTASKQPPQTLPATAARPLRILLVEDHGDTVRIMRRLLLADGHEVDTAADVGAALTLAGQKEFDLLLSDLGLPDGSGLDLMRALRARGVQLPGIALSGFGQEADILASRDAGFAAHLIKPVVLSKLEQTIAQVMADSSVG